MTYTACARATTSPAARTALRSVRRAWQPGAALACSGGHDSTALLLLAVEARRVGAIGDFIVLHVDHGVRSDSGMDAQFVSELCRATRTPFAQCSLTWSLKDARTGEDMLRRRRYAALARLTQRLGLTAVVTAHTRDDQVETVLMRLLSGAGPVAAAGMRANVTLPTMHGELRVLRPLLDVKRSDLDAILQEHDVAARTDRSNADTRYRRNALRLGALPTLRDAYPGFETALLRSMELSARDAAFVDRAAEAVFPNVISRSADAVTIQRAWLRTADPAIATRVLRMALRPRIGDVSWRELTFERIEAVRLAARGRSGAHVEMPGGVVATIEGEFVILHNRTQEQRVVDVAIVGES